MKIVDKINRIHASGGTTVSFEFFPAKSDEGTANLLQRVRSMGETLEPTFVTITWRSSFKDEKLWVKLGSTIQRQYNMDVLMHLTCHLPKTDLQRIVRNCREAGIRNILALRGDPPIGESRWQPVYGGFSNAIELVQMIRQEHGDYFCIAVAGYPEVHTECWNSPDLPPSEQMQMLDLDRLKLKQNAGADFIITQFFYDVEHEVRWLNKCREHGIHIPIVPGYMPIQSYSTFLKFTSWCKTKLPASLLADLAAVKDDDAAVRDLGTELAIAHCKQLLASGQKSLHFYTMNLAGCVTATLEGLKLAPETTKASPAESKQQRQPIKSATDEVRPIFWANRQHSYTARTALWDEYPNGRWGDMRSPAYGELTDYYLAAKRPKVDRQRIWGTPASVQEIGQVFVDYLDGKIPELPWCEQSLAGETSNIVTNLKWLNKNGFLTINSQPRLNAVPSGDQQHGWGGADGYLFQKAYVEFFCSEANLAKLLTLLEDFPSISYHALNHAGAEYRNTGEELRVNAVTWGVFPGREIVQPTVVDPRSFSAWKDEAFELWLSQWASTYSHEDNPASKAVVKHIHDTFFLVNLVDNDYISDRDFFSIFKRVITESMSEVELRNRVQSLEAQNESLYERVARLHSLQLEISEELRVEQEENAEIRVENSRLKALCRSIQYQQVSNAPKRSSTLGLSQGYGYDGGYGQGIQGSADKK